MFHSEQTPLLPRLGEVSAFDEALTSGKVYVLLFGLSIHSFFEGLGNCFYFSAMIVHVRFHVRVCVRVYIFRFKGSAGSIHFIFEIIVGSNSNSESFYVGSVSFRH